MRRTALVIIILIESVSVLPSGVDTVTFSLALPPESCMTVTESSINGSVIPRQLWNRTYSQSSYDTARSGIETQDGGLAILGSTTPPEGARDVYSDFWLIKTDPNGNVLWSRTYGGDSKDYAFSLIQTVDEGFALTGFTCSYGYGGADGWLIKTDAKGRVQWKQSYGGFSDDIAKTVIQTRDEGYLLGGRTASGITGSFDGWLVKIDRKGKEEWHRYGGGAGWDEITAVQQTPDGGYLFVGRNAIGESDSPSELWIGKTTATGELLWNYTYGGYGQDQANALIETCDGAYVIAGQMTLYINGSGTSEFWLLKIDAQGKILWNHTYGGIGEEIAYSVIQTADEGYALLGSTDSFDEGYFDFWLVKTDTNGTLQWSQNYGTSDGEKGYSLVSTADGGLVMIGTNERTYKRVNFSSMAIKIGGKLAPPTQPEIPPDLSLVNLGLPLLGGALLIVFVCLVWWRKSKRS